MGLRCSCGLRTNPIATGTIIFTFIQGGVLREGTLTIAANVCADRLELSTFSAIFVDQSGMTPNRSFEFTSTSITSVTCTPVDGICRVSITGMGLVAGELVPREFLVIYDNFPSPLNDRLTTFSVFEFVANSTTPFLTPDLTFFGCPTTP
jgi:hypothetical protein